MSDPLLERVDKRMSSLAADSVALTRQAAKLSLPFTLLNMEGNSHVIHLFEIPSDKTVFGIAPSEHPKFGVVTMNGCILVYNTMFRCIYWKQQTSLDQVSWGTFSWRKDVDPAIMMHSRQQGFHLVKPVYPGSGDPAANNNSNELLSSETHIGFCKPYLCSDQHVIVPIGNDKIGIHAQNEQSVPFCFTFDATVMAVKEIVNLDSSRYIICTTEDGYVHLLEASRNPEHDNVFQMKSLSKLLLPNYGDQEQQPMGICIEGDGSIFVIGSNLKYMFLLKYTGDQPNSLQPFGKKILPTEGVSCMALREGRGILAAGCFDGTVRIFGFPEMNQISTINYHKTQINTLLFINEKNNRCGRWYLLSGANDSGLSVWNMQSRKIE